MNIVTIKNRSIYLDTVRVLACLMVIIMHAPMANELASHHGFFLVAVGYFTSPCVCLFFMVSGALLLPVRNNVTTFNFLKKRLDRILLPTLFFSMFYILLNIGGAVEEKWIKSVLSIPLARQGHGILWFMYTLIGLYLLVPILSSWLRIASKSELKMYIILWFVTLCYPFLKAYLYIDSNDTGVLYYFSGYVGYFLLGYYLHRYPISLRWLLPIVVCILPLPLLVRKWDLGIDLNTAFSYLSAPTAILTATWFTICQKCADRYLGRVSRKLVILSNFSFGIYLVHIFFLRNVLQQIPIIVEMSNYYLQTIVLIFCTFMCSFLFCYLVYLLPIGKYVIGYCKNGT